MEDKHFRQQHVVLRRLIIARQLGDPTRPVELDAVRATCRFTTDGVDLVGLWPVLDEKELIDRIIRQRFTVTAGADQLLNRWTALVLADLPPRGIVSADPQRPGAVRVSSPRLPADITVDGGGKLYVQRFDPAAFADQELVASASGLTGDNLRRLDTFPSKEELFAVPPQYMLGTRGALLAGKGTSPVHTEERELVLNAMRDSAEQLSDAALRKWLLAAIKAGRKSQRVPMVAFGAHLGTRLQNWLDVYLTKATERSAIASLVDDGRVSRDQAHLVTRQMIVPLAVCVATILGDQQWTGFPRVTYGGPWVEVTCLNGGAGFAFLDAGGRLFLVPGQVEPTPPPTPPPTGRGRRRRRHGAQHAR